MQAEQAHKKYRVIGMMSGTSLDGVDFSLANYTKAEGKWHCQPEYCRTYPYTPAHIDLIHKMQDPSTTHLQFLQLQNQYTQVVADFLTQFVSLTPQPGPISLIAIHGHTIHHQPHNNVTVQACNLHLLAALTSLPVVGNFRQFDIANKKQGAPLVPYGEQIFPEGVYLNLGGVANVGYRGHGHDIVCCNLVLNAYSRKLGLGAYDEDGRVGATGVLDQGFRGRLDQQMGTAGRGKSLGREDVDWLLGSIDNQYGSREVLINHMHTFYHFIAHEIIKDVASIFAQHPQQEKVVVCTGGGALNKFLLSLLNQNQLGIEFRLPDRSVIEFKQALIFGLLGVKFMEGEPNCETGIGGQLVKGCPQ